MAYSRIMIIGSDAASDLYGGKLVQELKQLIPEAQFLGVGGRMMEESGVELLYDISDLLNLCGWESIKTSHVVKRLTLRASESMETFKPQLVIQVGLPVFSLRLIELAKTKGISVIYYNTPLNSSTSELKLTRLSKVVDKILAVSRHEKEICEKHNIDVDFVGHPLVDIVLDHRHTAEALIQQLNLKSQPVLTLLPGDCEVEIKAHLPTMLKAAKRVSENMKSIQIVTAVPELVRGECYKEIIDKVKVDNVLCTSKVHEILHLTDIAVVTSKDASIEAALAGIPAIAIHKMASATYFIDKMLSRSSHIAMVNFLMKTEIMSELIQNNFSEKQLAEAIIDLIQKPELQTEYFGKLAHLETQFGKPGAINRAAVKVVDFIKSEIINSPI